MALLLLSLLGYGFACFFYSKKEYRKALSLIVVSGLLIRLNCASDPFLHPWDERYHALVSKNLLKHLLMPTLYEHPILPFDYTNWTINHIWLHKQPLSLWLGAVSLHFFGVSEFSIRIPSVILSTIGIFLMYDIARMWFNQRTAVICAFLFSIHGFIIELAAGRTSTDHVDICFLFFILLAVWCSAKGFMGKGYWHILAGISLGLALLTKWLPALIVLPIWLALATKTYRTDKKRIAVYFSLIIITAAVVAIPWQLYIFHHYPAEARWEYIYNARHFFEPLEEHSGSIFYHIDKLRIMYGETVYIPVIAFTVFAFRNRTGQNIALLAWFWIPLLFFSLSATKMPAYTIISAPAIFIFTAHTFARLLELARAKQRAVKYILYTLAVSFIVLPARYSIERIKPFADEQKDLRLRNDIEKMKGLITNPEKTVIFNCPYYIEAMFYLGCTAYESGMDADEKNRLKRQGYEVIDMK